MSTFIDIGQLDPGALFWDLRKDQNVLCMMLDKEFTVKSTKVNHHDTTNVTKFEIPTRFRAIKWKSKNQKGVHFIAVPKNLSDSTFTDVPQFMTLGNAGTVEAPWEGWDWSEDPSDLFDWHGFHVRVEGSIITDTGYSKRMILEKFLASVIHLADNDYTNHYFQKLSDYELLDYTLTIARKNSDVIDQLVFC